MAADDRGGRHRHRHGHLRDRVPVLTGLTAGRVQQALPRAIDVAFVAVPTQRRPLQLVDRAGQVRFVTRAVPDLDAVLVTTALGQALATTPEQTVLDLGRAAPHGEDVDAARSSTHCGQNATRRSWPTSPGASGCRRR